MVLDIYCTTGRHINAAAVANGDRPLCRKQLKCLWTLCYGLIHQIFAYKNNVPINLCTMLFE